MHNIIKKRAHTFYIVGLCGVAVNTHNLTLPKLTGYLLYKHAGYIF